MFVQGVLLNFFGVSVKAQELLDRSEGLNVLAKRIRMYKDPVKQFRLLSQHKTPQWAKGCGWNHGNPVEYKCFKTCIFMCMRSRDL